MIPTETIPGLSAEAMQRLVRRQGLPTPDALERAGALVTELATRLVGDLTGQAIMVLVGRGGTGAVGLHAARLLHAQGAEVYALLGDLPEQLHAETQQALGAVRAAGMRPTLPLNRRAQEGEDEGPAVPWSRLVLVIDALLGIRSRGEPRSNYAELIRLANACRRPILSLDLPSGLDPTDGTIYDPTVNATTTLTLGLPKSGLLEGWPVVGNLFLGDMGLTPELLASEGVPSVSLFDHDSLVALQYTRHGWMRKA